MADDPSEPPSSQLPLTLEQSVVLAAFADHVLAGRKTMVRVYRTLCAIGIAATAIATLAYFTVGTIKDWPTNWWPNK